MPNASKLRRLTNIGSVRMSYSICCAPFLFGKPLVKNTFFKSFPKKTAQIVNVKNPELDLIRKILPGCGFYGFMIRFGFAPKKAKSVSENTCPIYTNGYDSSYRWSIGTNGTIGTNRKCHSSGSIGEYAFH